MGRNVRARRTKQRKPRAMSECLTAYKKKRTVYHQGSTIGVVKRKAKPYCVNEFCKNQPLYRSVTPAERFLQPPNNDHIEEEE